MKKIVLLLIASLVLVSCGRDKEPIGPNHNNNSNSSSSSSSNNNSGSSFGDTNHDKEKFAYINFVNVSKTNKYKCYVENIAVSVVKPNSNYVSTCAFSNGTTGTFNIKVEQYDNIYNDKMAVYKDNIIVYNGATHKAEFPYLDDLILINESNDDYYVTINDGMYELLVESDAASRVYDLDVFATYKIYVVQKNGYLFFPTKKTYYYTMNNSGYNAFKFNP